MKKVILLLLLLLISGCAVSKKVVGPDGEDLHMINCTGTQWGWADCFEKAGEICGAAGYEIIAGGSNSTPSLTSNQHGTYVFQNTTREMMIECKQPMTGQKK